MARAKIGIDCFSDQFCEKTCVCVDGRRGPAVPERGPAFAIPGRKHMDPESLDLKNCRAYYRRSMLGKREFHAVFTSTNEVKRVSVSKTSNKTSIRPSSRNT